MLKLICVNLLFTFHSKLFTECAQSPTSIVQHTYLKDQSAEFCTFVTRTCPCYKFSILLYSAKSLKLQSSFV